MYFKTTGLTIFDPTIFDPIIFDLLSPDFLSPNFLAYAHELTTKCEKLNNKMNRN